MRVAEKASGSGALRAKICLSRERGLVNCRELTLRQGLLLNLDTLKQPGGKRVEQSVDELLGQAGIFFATGARLLEFDGLRRFLGTAACTPQLDSVDPGALV